MQSHVRTDQSWKELFVGCSVAGLLPLEASGHDTEEPHSMDFIANGRSSHVQETTAGEGVEDEAVQQKHIVGNR